MNTLDEKINHAAHTDTKKLVLKPMRNDELCPNFPHEIHYSTFLQNFQEKYLSLHADLDFLSNNWYTNSDKRNNSAVWFFKAFFQVLNCIGEYLAQGTKEEKGQWRDEKANIPLSLAHVAIKEIQLHLTENEVQKPCT